MSLPVIDRDATLAAADDATRSFTQLLRTSDDPSATAIGHWSIAELACHVGHAYAAFSKVLRGEGSPAKDHRQMSQTWDRLVEEDPERDLNALADRIETSWQESRDILALKEWTESVSWHGGLDVPTYCATAMILNEASIHGLDVARAAKVDRRLEPSHARLAVYGMMPALPHFINHEGVKGLEATYELRIRGGWWVYATASGGRVTISEVTDRRVDCRISADPVAYLLVGFNRTSQWSAIAKGQLVAWGRKPWLSLTFAKLFDSP